MLKWHPTPCRNRAQLAPSAYLRLLQLRAHLPPGSPGAAAPGHLLGHPVAGRGGGMGEERAQDKRPLVAQQLPERHAPSPFQEPLPLSFPPRSAWTHLKTLFNNLPPLHDLTVATGNPRLLQDLFTTHLIRGCAKPNKSGEVSVNLPSVNGTTRVHRLYVIDPKMLQAFAKQKARLLPPNRSFWELTHGEITLDVGKKN